MLPPAAYLVRRRSHRAVYEKKVKVRSGQTVQLAGMTRVPYGRTVRKGHSADRTSAWSISAGADVSGHVLANTGIAGYGNVGLQVDLSQISLQWRLRYGQSNSENSDLGLTQHLLGTDLGAYKVFDIPRVNMGIGLGIRLGMDYVSQRFDTKGTANTRNGIAWRAAPLLRIEANLGSWAYLNVDGGADIYVVNELKQSDSGGTWTTRVVPFGALSLGVYLP